MVTQLDMDRLPAAADSCGSAGDRAAQNTGGLKTPWLRPRPRRERGQSLVEFSLMAVVLLTLLMGVIDLARAYFTYLALKDAAAEGSYFGAVFPTCTSETFCVDPNNIRYRARNSAPAGGLVDWTNAGVFTDRPIVRPGELITVTVTYNYQLITPVVGAIVGSQTIPLRAESVAVIISNKLP